ncbi:MAG: corrinoid protein [Chloroflexi bacterium]|nr:corrinoid protein [Chloroflexota bacterium]
MNEKLTALYNAIQEGDVTSAQAGVRAALEAGLEPGSILNEGMIAAMKEVGRLFEEGEYFVPEMLISARAMQGALVLLKPHLMSSDVKSAGKVAIGTIKGDLHDIGKNLVALMLEGAGFEIIDLGVDVAPDKFIDAISNNGADIVAFSALLTTTMPNMKTTIDAITQAGLRDKVKVIIGGAPVTQAYADQIGADGFASDASRAVSLATSLLG